jgi:VanZ family protein
MMPKEGWEKSWDGEYLSSTFVVIHFSGENKNHRFRLSQWMVPALIVALVCLLALPWIPLPSDTRLWKALHEFGHFPMYGGVALVMLYFARLIGKPRGWPSGRIYAAAFLGAVILGSVSEGVQSWISGRQSEWSDVLHDMAGAVCALGLFLTYDRDLKGRLAWWRQPPRKHIIYAGVGLVVLIVLSPVLKVIVGL